MTTVFVLRLSRSTLPLDIVRKLDLLDRLYLAVNCRGHRALPRETPTNPDAFPGILRIVVLLYCSYRRYISNSYSYAAPHEHKMADCSSNWAIIGQFVACPFGGAVGALGPG